MAGNHDLGYKFLFAHPEIVQELLSMFTPFPWLSQLASSDFERVNASYISEKFSERHDDIVWRVRLGDDWLYVYVLLEFQSRSDGWMALRMQVYIGLLYQDLVRRHEVSPRALLPPVLPLVFYNGADAWGAALDLGSLIMEAPAGLAEYQPAQRYFVIDQRRLDPAVLAQQRSILSTLFRLELSEYLEVINNVLPTLAAWLGDHEQSVLCRTVSLWVERFLRREFGNAPLFDASRLQELAMFPRKFETWTEAVEDRGRQKGLAEGLAEGRAKGIAEGMAEGRRNALRKVLSKRFGALPATIASRIDTASGADLDLLLDRSMDVDTLARLFGGDASA